MQLYARLEMLAPATTHWDYNDFISRSLVLKSEKDVAILGLSAHLLLQNEQRIKVKKRPAFQSPSNNIVQLVDCTPDYLPALTTLAALHEQGTRPYSDATIGNIDNGKPSV